MKAKLVIEKPAVLGEGPWWDEERQKLWWIDGLSENGHGDDLHCYDPASGGDMRWHIGKHIGCAIPTKDGRVLLTLWDGIWLFDPMNGDMEECSPLEREIENNRLNDGKCDRNGRLWFGSMSMTANQPERDFQITGSFYKMEQDRTVQCLFGEVGISNGLAWNADETQMYYVDSTTQCVFAFDFDARTGSISNRRVAVRVDESEGVPDGMTIDAEGKLWVAHFGGWKVSRFDPETGERLTEIFLPCAQVSSCCFGGAELDELYITTASIGLSQEERERQPLAGCLFQVIPGVKGTVLNRF
ncbi:SMP-30/gluconolactonase/LRE family protein [Oscillospiraceae bacterium 38-13]